MSDLLQRTPPHDLESERGVLGSILLRPQTIDDLSTRLEPEHFYDTAHQTLFDAMRALYQQQGRLDVLLLTNWLKDRNQFEQIGGAAGLAKISQAVPNAAHAIFYANHVRGKALLRAVLASATDTLIDAYNAEGMEPETVVEIAERRFTQLSLWRMNDDNVPRSIMRALTDTLAAMEQRRRDDYEGGVPTGFDLLDNRTGGWRPGNMIVVGGRPGNGKTALGLQMAYAAARENRPVMFYSLEMSEEELCLRLLSHVTRINGHRLRTSTGLRDSERELITERSGPLSLLPLYVQDDPMRTISQIASEARRQARTERGLGALFIDYMQLITPDRAGRGEKPSRQEQVAKMSRQIKQLAKDLQIPIVVLAQVGRDSAKQGRPPRLEELRESGAIEQDADMCVFIHRPRSEEPVANPAPSEGPTTAEHRDTETDCKLILAKNRMGPTAAIRVAFHRPTASFAEIEDDQQGHVAYDRSLPTQDRIDADPEDQETPF